ncbi:SAM-dependent methyltransferase [Chroococcidiopsis sp. CCALA 051]|uniref:SAM-dependent methyltransferase n=1 Tax=Chroococcidiopsis sp. CCALA 051 TaxID=869949 RepID=UPI000D0D1AFF|nr:SAM-dependent methyltransferase [Chroococcidiopsis sp. CCALA 051]PSM49227.1 SAM-dependent methyltransferase [Chroococcidiopsis sp. CCALA 051]
MISNSQKTKIEYGDFQTPLELANLVCQKLLELNISPSLIIEPTCGVGNFLEATAHCFKLTNKIIGVEVNHSYLQKLQVNQQLIQDERIEIIAGDFFQYDWIPLIEQFNEKILVIGNFPWVTNSRQGTIGSRNLPRKTNFQKYSGLDAITGKSNFDISEWMLIQTVHWLQKDGGYLAMLCKASVSRKILRYIYSKRLNIASCSTYKIDAKKYFNANIEACLLVCEFDSCSQNYYCNVFDSLESLNSYRIGYDNNLLVRNLESFQKLSALYDANATIKWRSGIKHDCSSVMEFRKIDSMFINGLGEIIDLEEDYLFPLIKGSDVAQNRIDTTNRYILVTQKFVGESTDSIKDIAPKTWQYLTSHAEYLDNRKSKIYQNNPRFSIFGVGEYTFAPWKIAICGLYKKLDFKLVANLFNKPVVFDDTVYFLSFTDWQIANKTFDLLTSQVATDFYSSLIFWDEKRPIKTSILNCLNLKALAEINVGKT